jgi:CubicO group peptidase (beta-lactamase class C family)
MAGARSCYDARKMSTTLSRNPDAAGLSRNRLARIRAKMENHIEAGRLAGGLGLILRRDHIGYFETWGMSDKEAGTPMREDAIFRIFSMTKAVTGVAAMMLFEEGAFALADPVFNFLPEFREMRVAVESPDPITGKMVLTGTQPAARPITVLDLMRHTAGFNYSGPHDENGDLVYPQRGIEAVLGGFTSAEFVKRLAGVPLVREPGTAWDYGFGTDVLGRLVEVISGQPLSEFFAQRIFEPLQMLDTTFYVHEEKWDRLVPIYALTPEGSIQRMTGPFQDGFRHPPEMCAGGAGLTSTAFDYLRFVRMLLKGGELDGERLLSPLTVELMRSDLLGDLPAAHPLLDPGHGFGLTFAISRGPGHGALAPAGHYRWGGVAGTLFWIDPTQDMLGIFMMQTFLDRAKRSEFMQLAYQSIID